jgi:hypothetical protein
MLNNLLGFDLCVSVFIVVAFLFLKCRLVIDEWTRLLRTETPTLLGKVSSAHCSPLTIQSLFLPASIPSS